MAIRKDKYCLKGEYYQALETISIMVGYSVPRSFRKEVSSDVLELLYRNQEMGKPLKSVIGEDMDGFIAELIKSFYETLNKKRLANYILQRGLIYSIICMILCIMDGSTKNSDINPFSLATIGCSIIGFILGIIYVVVNKNFICKLKGEKDI